MPIYEYACQQCGKINDILQKVTEPAPAQCLACGAEGTLTRVVSRTSFVLKGGGWYSDLYSSTKKSGSSTASESSSTSSSSSTSPSSGSSVTATSASGEKR